MKAFKDVQVICPSLTEVFLKVSEEWEGEPMVEWSDKIQFIRYIVS